MLITPEYREQNRQLHVASEDYGNANSEQHANVAKMILETGITDVLDYGCGRGQLAQHLPFPIKEYDPAIPGKDNPAEPAEMVICRDVLEHIEPECIDDVLDDLARVTKRFGFFVIALGPSTDRLPDGRNAHILQRSQAWWEDRLNQRFDVLETAYKPGFANLVNKPGYFLFAELWAYVRCRA